jgi:hypothetical protein
MEAEVPNFFVALLCRSYLRCLNFIQDFSKARRFCPAVFPSFHFFGLIIPNDNFQLDRFEPRGL